MTTGPVDPVAAGHGRFRASDADRERAIETLTVAFAQGCLTRDDLDQRAGRALLARTYAELAGATADIPVRPAPVRLRSPGRADWPPPALAALAESRPRANHWAFSWALGLATIVLPVMITAALRERSQDLFCVSIVLLMAYVMAAVIAGANVVAARFDDRQSSLPGSPDYPGQPQSGGADRRGSPGAHFGGLGGRVVVWAEGDGAGAEGRGAAAVWGRDGACA